MIQNDVQVGLEVINPCAGSVEFDNKGVPITHKAGHGIGMRSIVAFAESNGYLLDFRYDQKKFAMRLVMRVTG